MSFLSRATVLLLASPLAVHAGPEAGVRTAFEALRDVSGYTWETTARQNTTEIEDFAPAEEQRSTSPSIEVRGKTVVDGFTEIELPPSRRGVEVPVRAYIKSSVEAVAHTPLGWLTRQEMRDSPRARDTVAIDGKPVRLSRLFAAATRATNIETPTEELRGLLADVARYEDHDDVIIGHLHPGAAAMLRDPAQRSSSAPGLAGRIIFRIRGGELQEYEVNLETEVPRTGRPPIRRREWWKTTLRGIGTTTVDPPREVVTKLEAETE